MQQYDFMNSINPGRRGAGGGGFFSWSIDMLRLQHSSTLMDEMSFEQVPVMFITLAEVLLSV